MEEDKDRIKEKEKEKEKDKSSSRKTSNSAKKVKSEKNPEPENRNETMVPIPLSFIRHLNSVLLIANQRATWQPNELIPVGSAIKELTQIINYYDSLNAGTSEP